MTEPRCPKCGSISIIVVEMSRVYWRICDVTEDTYESDGITDDGIWAHDGSRMADGTQDDHFVCNDCSWSETISPESRKLLMGEEAKEE